MFNEDLRSVRADFDKHRKNLPITPIQPTYAGAALWAKGLLLRVQATYQVLEKATFLAVTADAEEGKRNYLQLCGILESYMRQQHAEWIERYSPLNNSDERHASNINCALHFIACATRTRNH